MSVSAGINRIIILITLFMFVGCSSKTKQQIAVRRMYGRTIEYANNYIVVDKDTFTQKQVFKDDVVTLVAYIDSVICSKCALNEYQLFRDLFDQYDKSQFKLLLIVGKRDPSEVKGFLSELDFPYEVYIDNGWFYESNKLSTLSPQNRSFLLDKESKVRLIGDPFLNKKIFDLYSETMQNLIMKQPGE